MVRLGKSLIKGSIPVSQRTLAIAVLAFAAACSTQPPKPEVPAYAAGYLSPDAQVYGRVNLDPSPELRAALSQHASIRDVVNRSKVVWFSFDLEGLQPRNWRLALTGDFPKGLVSWALDGKPDWKKSGTPGPQWRNDAAGISVAVPEDGVIDASPVPFTADQLEWKPGISSELPAKLMESSDLSLTVLQPAQALFGDAGTRLFPVQDLRLALKASSDGWTGPVILEMPDERSAKASAVLLKLWSASAALAADGSAQTSLQTSLAKLAWHVEGNSIVGENLTIAYKDLSGLLDKLLSKTEATQP